MNQRSILQWAGLLGAAGVALGAFGAHALREVLQEKNMLPVWESAVRYQLIHAVALLALAAWARGGALPGALTWAARLWLIGVPLFSGSLYALAMGAPHWLGAVTPFGGAAFIAGWIAVIVAAAKKPDETKG